MQIIDTHAHLDHLENLELALSNAHAAGVEAIVCISMDLASCKRNLEIKQKTKFPKVYLAMGMHPSEVKLADLDTVVELLRTHKNDLSAVGEIGLDFWYKWVRKDEDKKNEQRIAFRRLLELAKELGLPAVIHSRGAWRECLETAQSVGIKKALLHWYSGPLDVLDDVIAAGYYVSTSPSVAYSPQSREAMARAPIERTLIETDCPVFYKNPATEEGFQAEPKDVVRTLKAYSELKGMSEGDALKILNANAKYFFNLN